MSTTAIFLDDPKLDNLYRRSEEFREKHDRVGGGTVSEIQAARELFLSGDAWTGFKFVYSVAWSRGYRAGQRQAKKTRKRKEALSSDRAENCFEADSGCGIIKEA